MPSSPRRGCLCWRAVLRMSRSPSTGRSRPRSRLARPRQGWRRPGWHSLRARWRRFPRRPLRGMGRGHIRLAGPSRLRQRQGWLDLSEHSSAARNSRRRAWVAIYQSPRDRDRRSCEQWQLRTCRRAWMWRGSMVMFHGSPHGSFRQRLCRQEVAGIASGRTPARDSVTSFTRLDSSDALLVSKAPGLDAQSAPLPSCARKLRQRSADLFNRRVRSLGGLRRGA